MSGTMDPRQQFLFSTLPGLLGQAYDYVRRNPLQATADVAQAVTPGGALQEALTGSEQISRSAMRGDIGGMVGGAGAMGAGLLGAIPLVGMAGRGVGSAMRAAREAPEVAQPMVALHNTSPEKLARVSSGGNVAVAPSIAISRADDPLTGFGDISLLAPTQMVNPRNTPVFARDAYTPRYPQVETKTVRGEEREVLPFISERTGDWRSLPNTPENALKIMKSGPWRGGEQWITDNWLLGQLAPQFRTMSEMRASRQRLVPSSDETTKNWIEGLDSLRNEWSDAIKNAGRRIDYGFYDDLNRNFAEAMQRGPGGIQKINSDYYGGVIPENLLSRTRDYLETGRNLPSTYFEAKPRRLVPLNEFEGALIPSNTQNDVREILQKNNINNVVEYSDPQDRIIQMQKFRDLFFSGALPGLLGAGAAGAGAAEMQQ